MIYKFNKISQALTVAAMASLFFACNPQPNSESAAEYNAESTDTVAAQERQRRFNEFDRELRTQRERLTEFRNKVTNGELAATWDETVTRLEKEADDLRIELDDISDDTQEAWNEFQARAENKLTEIRNTLDQSLEKTAN